MASREIAKNVLVAGTSLAMLAAPNAAEAVDSSECILEERVAIVAREGDMAAAEVIQDYYNEKNGDHSTEIFQVNTTEVQIEGSSQTHTEVDRTSGFEAIRSAQTSEEQIGQFAYTITMGLEGAIPDNFMATFSERLDGEADCDDLIRVERVGGSTSEETRREAHEFVAREKIRGQYTTDSTMDEPESGAPYSRRSD